jgi:hypothetical protein
MPTGVRPSASPSGERLAGQRGQRVEHDAGLAAPVARRREDAVPDRPGEVERAHGQVVDVHLEPERHHAVGIELDRLGRTADGARVLLPPGLAQQPALDELRHQARDGRLVEAGLDRDGRARARAVLRDVLEHDTQVRAPHAGLIDPAAAALAGPLLSQLGRLPACGWSTPTTN